MNIEMINNYIQFILGANRDNILFPVVIMPIQIFEENRIPDC